jgi:hypothetical protein
MLVISLGVLGLVEEKVKKVNDSSSLADLSSSDFKCVSDIGHVLFLYSQYLAQYISYRKYPRNICSIKLGLLHIQR